MDKNIDINYKNQKRYKTAKYPIRQPLFFVWLIWVLSFFALLFKKKKIEKPALSKKKINDFFSVLKNPPCIFT